MDTQKKVSDRNIKLNLYNEYWRVFIPYKEDNKCKAASVLIFIQSGSKIDKTANKIWGSPEIPELPQILIVYQIDPKKGEKECYGHIWISQFPQHFFPGGSENSLICQIGR